MKPRLQPSENRWQKGQGMVEVSLFIPVFIIILAGLVEVSQIVVTQNRVSNAARTGTRFAANGGENDGVVRVALDAITQTLAEDERDWDIWLIRGKVNSSGDGFAEWDFEHTYGLSSTKGFTVVKEANVKAEVLAELQKDLGGSDPSIAAGLQIVATYMVHDLDSMLGLSAIPWLANINSVRSLSVMRVVGFDHIVTLGCDAFPIAIHEDITSVTPVGTGPNPYPEASEFGGSSPKPLYDSFTGHTPNVKLIKAGEGDLFRIENGFGNGNFGWLRWNQGRPDDENTLSDSLTYPGNSTQYFQVSGGSGLPDIGRVNGYVDPHDVTDLTMNVGDWVPATTGNVNSNKVRAQLDYLIQSGNAIRVIIWDQALDQGNYGEYQIKRFAIFQLHGYNLTSSDSWVLAEFIRWDDSCGQV
jgi:hypothetical protein